MLGVYAPAIAQIAPPPNPPPARLPPAVNHPLPPLGIYAIASIGCAAVSPIIGTIILNRELTLNEAYRSTLGCFLGPVGWLLADLLVPPQAIVPPPPGPPPQPPQPQLRVSRASHVNLPPRGETHFVRNEILVEVDANAAARFAALARRLQLTRLETQSFALTGRTLQRWRIDGGRSVRATLAALGNTVTDAQANYLYGLPQLQAGASDASAQYVVPKLHLTEAHRISNGDDVVVAVIDSKIDAKHPDLAGVIADEDDVLATGGPAHMHGTAMAGAIAAHSRLVGVAPKVRLLAVRVFSGPEDSAQGSTFDILKGLDWAASRNARIVNMSFAGPSDPLLREMLGKAHARGMVLIAAVGNAGPRSPPLYPAAYPDVIGVTATDADDRLLPQANRGPQVAVAAPGVNILAAAPDDKYQITTGTSVAAAHVTGVAALMLAQDPALKPDDVRKRLLSSVRVIPGARRDVGAGVVDALTAVRATAKAK
jgi:subtilisin family serine protease